MNDKELTRILFMDNGDEGEIEIEGYAHTIQAGIHSIIQAASQMTGKSVKQYLSELIISQVLTEVHDCSICDVEDCEERSEPTDCASKKEDMTGITFEHILDLEFGLEDDDE